MFKLKNEFLRRYWINWKFTLKLKTLIKRNLRFIKKRLRKLKVNLIKNLLVYEGNLNFKLKYIWFTKIKEKLNWINTVDVYRKLELLTKTIIK